MKYFLIVAIALIMIVSVLMGKANANFTNTVTIVTTIEDITSGVGVNEIEKNKRMGFRITYVVASGAYVLIIMEKY